MRTLAYVRPTLASSAVVSDFASTLRAEQLRHLDAVRRACAILDGHAGRLPALASAHGTLTRQWFDAQRSLLGLCAQLDAEAESADQLDLRAVGLAEDIAQALQALHLLRVLELLALAGVLRAHRFRIAAVMSVTPCPT